MRNNMDDPNWNNNTPCAQDSFVNKAIQKIAMAIKAISMILMIRGIIT